MPILVQLLAPKQIEVQGRMRAYSPGDWVRVGKQMALQWVAAGQAYLPESQLPAVIKPGTCGVLVIAGDVQSARARLGSGIEIDAGDPELAWDKTLLWDAGLPIRPGLVAVGFHVLDTWEIAVPLYSYDHLALAEGTDDDRERTRLVIRDLRVPLYDTRLVFVKKCAAGEQLLTAWIGEREGGESDRLALLRALYRVKPLVLALPTTWTQ